MKISIINDEISKDLYKSVSFLKEHKIKYIELRSINNINILNIPLKKLHKIKKYLDKKNIQTSCIASPILKWYPKKTKSDLNLQKVRKELFYFKTKKNHEQEYNKIFKIANIFETKYIRIFSFLKYNNFQKKDLYKELNKLLKLAQQNNKILLLENEPACNINSIKDLLEIIKKYNSKNLKILLDIGNLYKENKSLKNQNIKKIIEHTEYLHIKDYSKSKNKYVALGEGNINYKKHLSLIKKLNKKNLIYSIETHTYKNKYKNSSNSIKTLKNILKDKRIKYGIIGCGRISTKHFNAIKNDKQSELVGVFDINKMKMKKAANKNDCEYYNEMKELIKNVDVVNICTPHNTHKDIIIKTLELEKKCLCEKPVCLNDKEANSIRKIKKYNKNIFTVFQNRYNHPILFINKIIKNNKLGKILFVSANVRWFRNKKYYKNTWQGKKRLEGGILFNQGIHIIDIIMNIFPKNSKLKIINTFKEKIYHNNIDTEDLFLAQFKSNKSIFNLEITVSTIPCNLESSLLFIFEKGNIEIGGLFLNKLNYINLKTNQKLKLKKENHTKNTTNIYGYGHSVLISKLSKYLLKGKPDKNIINFEESYKRISFINKLYQNTQ